VLLSGCDRTCICAQARDRNIHSDGNGDGTVEFADTGPERNPNGDCNGFCDPQPEPDANDIAHGVRAADSDLHGLGNDEPHSHFISGAHFYVVAHRTANSHARTPAHKHFDAVHDCRSHTMILPATVEAETSMRSCSDARGPDDP
jgi:hypothetical protein